MQCYTELLPPSGVTHALAIPFISATADNLVVVKTSILQIFSLLKVQHHPRGGTIEGKSARPDQLETTKLVLEREYPLPGTVVDICRVKILNPKSGGEALLLAFRNAKLSLVEWDPERRGISTISIHYYERDDLTRSPWVPDLSSCGSILSVDPSSRCAVFNFGIRNLAILPFHQPGDDLAMDDYEFDLHQDGLSQVSDHVGNDLKDKDRTVYQTPYASSFVLPLTALDPSILHPISLAFLYEYREPTFGILYSQIATSHALLPERKDSIFYTVFTLDLEQRASTTLLSVPKLPSDLFKVVALPPPVGGALLIGSNELVHVDQAGKTNAVGVNEFARQVSAFSMVDQSDLALRLEGCVVEHLSDSTGDLLLVLSSGNMVVVHFQLDGRSVSGISLRPLPAQAGGAIMKSAASSSAFLGSGRVFFGSEGADSVLLGWSSLSSNSRKPRPRMSNVAEDREEALDDSQSEEDVYEDDLYTAEPETQALGRRPSAEKSGVGMYKFQVLDRLPNIGPLRDITLGKPASTVEDTGRLIENASSELELVAAQGSGRNGGLVLMKREIEPDVAASFDAQSVKGVWTAVVALGSGTPSVPDGQQINQEYRQYVILSKPEAPDKEQSEVFIADTQDLKPFKAPEFNPNNDVTIEIGTLSCKRRVVQVLRNEVRSYDIDLGLAQIYPVWDEDTSDERMAVSASLADPYIAILRDDSTLMLLQADDSGDLDEVELNDSARAGKWRSCCLYWDKAEIFSSTGPISKQRTHCELFLFLLSIDCRLYIYRLPDQQLMSVIEGIDCLPPILSTELPKRSTTREVLSEAVIADLGESWNPSPHLILRTESDDLVVYKAFASSIKGEGHTRLSFVKEANHTLPRATTSEKEMQSNEELSRSRSLRILPNISDFSAVFMPGPSASFVLKTAKSCPHVFRLRGEFVRSLSIFSLASPSLDKGFIYVDSKDVLRICRFPSETLYDYTWALRKIDIGEQVDHLVYATSSETYVLGTSHSADFKLPEDDELHPDWRNEVISFLPELRQCSLKVVSPRTWTVIDSYSLGPAEYVMAVKNMDLEVSENTHERRNMIVVGTAFARGEDIPSRGCIYVFEVIKVVPDPEKPETNRKLKLIGKELVKGAVTALSQVGGQGFLIAAQGQKCMVRGLKEDGSLLPVAFMDMQCYVNVVKELKGTGMCIMGDAVKGLWFAGYSEEPYKMSLFGKDQGYLEVVAADFLPDGDKLFILVADSDCNLHVLQYDPEDPKSSNGDRLLARSKFHMGHFATTMTLLPRTMVSSEKAMAGPDSMEIDSQTVSQQVLITSQSGSVGIVTSVSEESYRRLSALQSQLTNSLEHPCGLNPRAYRAVESDGTAGRGMLDGNLLYQWLDMGQQRKMEIAARVGAHEWEIRADLEAIGGEGLGYL
ncbi:cleavage/polyadenylation factor CFT1 [Aspergillus udagawae]|uniref:Protein CFT1 n=1 Tax=Aspergillus udagawae TaxID=91492 RepID=A0A8E0V0G8_9EURO|nr:mRNA cleavage and polyadenylation factor subunit [Aspergillus udagawae]GIC92592.1 mRNA cleavage and polyadenylation factor subunit [Aspergillus udagawae]